jgi:hypothetical protein
MANGWLYCGVDVSKWEQMGAHSKASSLVKEEFSICMWMWHILCTCLDSE